MNVSTYNKTPQVSYYKNSTKEIKYNHDTDKKGFKNEGEEYYSPFINKEIFTNTYKAKPQLNSKKLPSVFELPKESFMKNIMEEEKKVYKNLNPMLHKQNSNIFRDEYLGGSYERSTLFEHVNNLLKTLLIIFIKNITLI